jgi:hypothetical protein
VESKTVKLMEADNGRVDTRLGAGAGR